MTDASHAELIAELRGAAADRYDDFETFLASDGHRSIRMHGLSTDDWLRAEAARLENGDPA